MESRQTHLVALVDSAAQMGGVEFSTLYLAQWLDLTTFQRVVICPQDGDLPQRCREAHIPVEIVQRPHMADMMVRIGRRYVPNPLAWARNSGTFLVAARVLACKLRELRVDLVCTKGMFAHFYGGLAARRLGLACVWHVQDLVSQRAGNIYPTILGRAGQWLAHRVIADGETIREQLAPFIPSERLTVIHNGVDTSTFSPEVDGRQVRHEWNVEDSDILIGNAARLTPWKGQDYLIKAFGQVAAEFPRAKLVLVGSPVFDTDNFERTLRQLAGDFGLQDRIIFAGFRWDLPQVLAAMDVFVHSSVTKDTSPLAVVSAMASGKAIVSSDVGGVAEMFTPGVDGILVRRADEEDLAMALRDVLASPERRAALGKAARATAEQSLSLSRFARRCEAVFGQALRMKSKSLRSTGAK